MTSRSKYKTKQRYILLAYLESIAGLHFTAGDVCEYFKEEGASIGQSTIYRHLENLVDEGLIKKYIIDSNSPACFEYVGHDSPEDENINFHCKCEKCGKLIHLNCNELEELQVHLHEKHQFKMNPIRTVLYGLCQECM